MRALASEDKTMDMGDGRYHGPHATCVLLNHSLVYFLLVKAGFSFEHDRGLGWDEDLSRSVA